MKKYPTTTLVVDLRLEVEVPAELSKIIRADMLHRSFSEGLSRPIKPGLDVQNVEVLQYFNM
jgi:hypothetical protein